MILDPIHQTLQAPTSNLPTPKPAVIEISDLSKVYVMGKTEVHALREVSLTIRAGEYVAIVGASGSGKSTLMNMIGLLDRPSHGSYRIRGAETSQLSKNRLADLRNQEIGFVFQRFNLLARTTARRQVELPLFYAGVAASKMGKMALTALQQVHLDDRATHKPDELSGGQQQRVAIARALVNHPSLLLADEPTGALDSKTGSEVLSLFDELHHRGLTVIVVTHDHTVAQRAERIVTLKDGYIISDERKAPPTTLSAPKIAANITGNQPQIHGQNGNGQHANGFDRYALVDEQPAASNHRPRQLPGLKLLKYLGVAIESVLANKLRASLTMLGIIIGVAAVLTTSGIGTGAAASITSRIESQGTNLLTVNSGSNRGGGASSSTLTIDDANVLADKALYPEFALVVPEYTAQATLTNGDLDSRQQVIGTTADYATVRNLNVEVGRFLTHEEVINSQRVAVLGSRLSNDLFGTLVPVGKIVRINNEPFQVIGVLKTTGGAGFGSNDNRALVPISVAQGRLFNAPRYRGTYTISSISIQAADKEQIDQAQQQIEQTLRMRHGLSADDDNDFTVFNQASLLEVATGVAQTLTIFLGGIGAVSLLVGGIGIMNIMLVSVTERTKEIGLRKALGAHDRDILLQFVIEALVLCTLGGLIGMGLSYGTGYLVSQIPNFPFPVVIETQALVLALSVSAGCGLIFGLYPAVRATWLDPIDALRYE